MTNNHHLFNYGVLAAALVYDYKVNRKTKNAIQEVLQENQDLKNMLIADRARVIYLATMIENAEIPITEFDLIILNDPK